MEDPNNDKPASWECQVCGHVYIPAEGDPTQAIPPGTPFEKLPDDWICPVCGATKDMYKKLKF